MAIPISWTAPTGNPNVTSQIIGARVKDIGGSYLTTNFTPSNPMGAGVQNATFANTFFNKIYQFQSQSGCTLNGPVNNTTGILEGLMFACITPTLTSDGTNVTISLSVTGTNITKAKFYLYNTSNVLVYVSPVTAVASNAVGATKGGLPNSTEYYWKYELFATVNGREVISSALNYLGNACGNYTTSTTSGSGTDYNVRISRSVSNPFVNTSTVPTGTDPIDIPFTHNGNLSMNVPAGWEGYFVIVRWPIGEPAKTLWTNSTFASGTLSDSPPDSQWRAPFTIGSYVYDVSRDAAGISLDFSQPLVFS